MTEGQSETMRVSGPSQPRLAAFQQGLDGGTQGRHGIVQFQHHRVLVRDQREHVADRFGGIIRVERRLVANEHVGGLASVPSDACRRVRVLGGPA